jgi:hypothetical protein
MPRHVFICICLVWGSLRVLDLWFAVFHLLEEKSQLFSLFFLLLLLLLLLLKSMYVTQFHIIPQLLACFIIFGPFFLLYMFQGRWFLLTYT